MVEILKRTPRILGLSLKSWEISARLLSVISFVALCWVAHRALQVRTQCVHSSFISLVQMGDLRVGNCMYESRLSLRLGDMRPDAEQTALLRSLEVLEPLRDFFSPAHPSLTVEVDFASPQNFELRKGFVRIGRYWLEDSQQTLRGLTMALLNQLPSQQSWTPFHLEVVTDFLLVTVLRQDRWQGHSMRAELRFSTASASFEQYCQSPFRSLALGELCSWRRPAGADVRGDVWSLKPVLAMSLGRVFEKLSLRDQLSFLNGLRTLERGPDLPILEDGSLASRVLWLQTSLTEYLQALGVSQTPDVELAIRRTHKELEFSTPTRWELTVDILHTPAWREVLEQFRKWSKLHPGQRVLVFTPNGSIALPADLPVGWEAKEIQSQKHVMIACEWPKAGEALHITSRLVYAQQSCGKVDRVFWN